MSKVRIAVVGAGLIGRKHIEVLRAENEHYELAGVADPSPAAAEEARRLGYPCHASLEELLAREQPEGAVLAVPNQLHVQMGLACVAKGVAILIEKPVADRVGDGLKLIEAAEKVGVPTLTGHHRRHNPIMRTAAEIIRAGRIGRPVAATSLWLTHKPKGYHDAQWRREPGGGPVLINAIHEIDNLRMLLGEIATVQAADSSAVRGFKVEDTAAAVLRFESGALGTLIVSDAASSPWTWEWGSGENTFFPRRNEDCLFVAGTTGSLAVPSLHLRWHEPDRQSWATPLTEQRVPYAPADPYVEQMRNFAAVIRKCEKPVLSGRDGLRTLAATLAITISARTGAPVHVNDLISGRIAA